MIPFISDVIYGLKTDYGSQVTLKRITATLNPETGKEETQTISQFYIPLAIPLPENQAQSFLRSIGVITQIYLQEGERMFLIDAVDIPRTKDIKINDRIIYSTQEYTINKIHDYDAASILIAKRIK